MSSSAAISSVRDVDTFLGVLTVTFGTEDDTYRAACDIRTASEVHIDTSTLTLQGYYSKRRKIWTLRILCIVNGTDTGYLDRTAYQFKNDSNRNWSPVEPMQSTEDVLRIYDYIHTEVWRDELKFFYDMRAIRGWPRKEYMTEDDKSTATTVKSSGAAQHPEPVIAQVIKSELVEDLDSAIKRRRRMSDRLKKITPKDEGSPCPQCKKPTKTVGASSSGSPVKWCDDCGGA